MSNEILPILIIECLHTATFPDCWKKGRLIWIPKCNKNIDGSMAYSLKNTRPY